MTTKKAALELKEEKAPGAAERLRIRATKPVQLRIGYIGGGGRGWSHALIRDLAGCPWLGGEVRLYDLDYEAARFNASFGNWVQGHPDNRSRWTYRAVRTLGEALKGVDFVFVSIQPGPIEFMKHDLEIPMRYGVFQPVGDTTGPGGLVRALRSARIYRGFAEAIAEHAPSAWVLNFTNPMTVCTRTLYSVFPGVKAYGCCHEVFGTQGLLAELAAGRFGVPKPPRGDIKVNVLGVNHFTWIDRAEWAGRDLLAVVREHVRKPNALRFHTKAELDRKSPSMFVSMHRVAFELMLRFDALAAAGDRHLAEFVPWFLTDRDSCYKWGFRLTPYSYRARRWREAPKLFRRQMAGREPYSIRDSGEEYVAQMSALLGLTELRTNVNLPNRGQMPDLPADAVVETNALFSRNRVEPVCAGRLPAPVNALVMRHVVNQESIVRAALTNDEELAFRAFVSDPLMGRVPIDAAARLFGQMLAATRFTF